MPSITIRKFSLKGPPNSFGTAVPTSCTSPHRNCR
jgi:hypothetical protein